MEVDRENPAFVLLPESPPQLTEDKEVERTQFELDQSESPETSLRLLSLDPLKPSSHEDEDDSHENLQVTFG
ncbi:unnamed protein product [Hydatigera taeniaeformis]|uniref:Ovule protein n=1 Tax=Hydatigena taeniaeformis TaxID=6205 RepID=A0A0R3WZ26_HYDTA|nr:unnamed protein product [Hydatigera taeniaeformis]